MVGETETQEANLPRVMELEAEELELNQVVGLQFPSLPSTPQSL